MKYGGNKSEREQPAAMGFKSLRTIDTRRSPERFRHHLLHALLSSLTFTCKNSLDEIVQLPN